MGTGDTKPQGHRGWKWSGVDCNARRSRRVTLVVGLAGLKQRPGWLAQQTPRLVAWRLGSFPRSHTSFPSFFWPGVDDVVYIGLRSRPWPTFHYGCTLCGCYAFGSPGVLRTRQLIPTAKGGGWAFRGTLGIHATRRAPTRPCVYLCRPGAIQKQGLVQAGRVLEAKGNFRHRMQRPPASEWSSSATIWATLVL